MTRTSGRSYATSELGIHTLPHPLKSAFPDVRLFDLWKSIGLKLMISPLG